MNEINKFYERHFRHSVHVSRHLDVVVIGAGPAGLAAGYRLSEAGLSFSVYDAGSNLEARKENSPKDLVAGVGGAGLFSDGKFSFYPSASGLWALEDEKLVRDSYRWFQFMLASIGQKSPDLPEKIGMIESASAGQKIYPSFYVPFEKRKQLAQLMSEKIGESLQVGSKVISIREEDSGFSLFVLNSDRITKVSCRALVFAGGRFGAEDLFRACPELPAVFKRYEIGIRLEQANEDFVYKENESTDIKFITKGNDKIEEWRTFCTCRAGEVIETKWESISSFSGRGDGTPGPRTNIGLNIRFGEIPEDNGTHREILKLMSGGVGLFRMPVRQFIDSNEVLMGPELDKRFRSKLLEILEGAPNLNDAKIFGPCIEGIGFYPDINKRLKVNSRPIWVAGDSSGIFRGITAAFVSGHFCAEEVVRHFGPKTTLPRFIKQSSADPIPVIFTAQSKNFFYCRDAICEFVLAKKMLPINPFRVFDYFLSDRVPRDTVRQGNNQLISISDELWVFGTVSDGVLFEIVLARQLRKPIRYFSISAKASEIREIRPEEVKFEPEIHAAQVTKDNLRALLADTLDLPHMDVSQLGLFDNAD